MLASPSLDVVNKFGLQGYAYIKSRIEGSMADECSPVSTPEAATPARENAKCGICMVEMNTDQDHRSVSLPCGHVFDQACVDRWVDEMGNHRCPHCNKELKTGDVVPLFLDAPLLVGGGLSEDERCRLLEACDKASDRVFETRLEYRDAVLKHATAVKKLDPLALLRTKTREELDIARDAFREVRANYIRVRLIPDAERLGNVGMKLEDMPTLNYAEIERVRIRDHEKWATMNNAKKRYRRVQNRWSKAAAARMVAQGKLISSYRAYYNAVEKYRDAREAVGRALNQ